MSAFARAYRIIKFSSFHRLFLPQHQPLHSRPPILITFPTLVFIFKQCQNCPCHNLLSRCFCLRGKKSLRLSHPSPAAQPHAASIIVYCLGPPVPRRHAEGNQAIYEGVISYLGCTCMSSPFRCDRVNPGGIGRWTDSSESAT